MLHNVAPECSLSSLLVTNFSLLDLPYILRSKCYGTGRAIALLTVRSLCNPEGYSIATSKVSM